MRKFVVMLALGLMIGTASMAQAQKFGHINSAELLKSMPEITKADNDLKAFAKQYSDQMESMQKEGQKKVQEYQAADKTMSDAVRTVKQKELQDLQNRLESFQQTADEKISARKNELYTPIIEKADKAIKDVAKEKGYSYVFDTSNGTVLYATDGDNILPLVKAKLGMK